jgi:branched-chain amino acid transport system substrate-binding protein
MSTNHHAASRRRLRAVLVIVAMLAAACGSDGDDEATSTTTGEAVPMAGVPGVTATEIRYAAIGTDSNNPTGTCYMECFLNGVRAHFAYRNSEGGIYGRKLALDTPLDDELGKNLEKAVQVISADDTFGAFSMPIIGTGYAAFHEKGWPLYTYLTDHKTAAGMENLFASYSVACLGACPRIDYPFVMEATGSKKAAVLGFGVAKGCVGQAEATFEKYADVTDARIAYTNEELAFGLPNGIAPEVTAMKKAGVDLVFGCLDSNTMKALAQEAARQSYDPTLVFYAGFNQAFFEENASVLDGSVIGTHLRPLFSTPTPGQKAYRTWMEKSGKPLDENSVHGWIAADLAYKGLEAAGAPLTRAKVIAATNALKGYTADGWINPRDIGRSHEPQTPTDAATHGETPYCMSYFRLADRDFEVLAPGTDAKPYICWPGTTYDYSEPEARSF